MPNESKILWPGWETGRLIGRGSFGAVYEIKRDVFGDTEKAALKVISIPQNDGDIEEMYSDGYDDESITSTFQSHLKSIVAEYSLMRKLSDCPNVVNCDDIRYIQHEDKIGWDIYIKMELLTPLTKTLPDTITDDLVIKLGVDMCHALEMCNKYNIIHRDIKPQNIFVSANGIFKLGDFGIAKTVEKTMGGTKIGTYKYMAPEVCHYQPYGCSADLYSLGLVLYWMLNERRLPFLPLPPKKLGAGMDELARERRLSGEPIPAPAHGSAELKRIVLKACAFDPKERYASAADMVNDLKPLYSTIMRSDMRVSYEQKRSVRTRCLCCGAQMLAGQRFCTKCGVRSGETVKSNIANNKDNNHPIEKEKHTSEKAPEMYRTEPEKKPQRSIHVEMPSMQRQEANAHEPPKINDSTADRCMNCGATLLNGRIFCIKCGAHINPKSRITQQEKISTEQAVEERFRLLRKSRERQRLEQEKRERK